MELSTHLEAIAADLAAITAAGDEQTGLAAERLIRALEPSLRLHLLDVLSDAAAELDPQLPSGRVDVRLSGGDVALVYIEDPSATASGPADDDLSARITLRLPDRLKSAAEVSAASDGMSLNAWLIRSVKAALDRRPPGRGLKGFARS